MQGSFDKLLIAVQSFADVLDENVPALQTDSFSKEEEVRVQLVILFLCKEFVFLVGDDSDGNWVRCGR